MNLIQQLQTERIVNKLEELGHSIEDILSCINDFKNPTKEIVGIYTDVYSNNGYDSLIIYEIGQVLSEILAIREQLLEDMEGLGFDYDENSFYKGLNNFSLFIDYLFKSMNDNNIDGETKKHIYHNIKLKEREDVIKEGIGLFFLEMQGLVFQDLSYDELEKKAQELYERINRFFKKYKIYYDGNFMKLGLENEETNYKTSRHSKECLEYSYRGVNKKIVTDQKVMFISYFCEYVKNKKKYDEKFEEYRPSDKMFEDLYKDKFIYGAKGAYLRFLKSFLDGQKVYFFKLLPSIEVSVDLYKKWEKGEDISNDLKLLYDESIKLTIDEKILNDEYVKSLSGIKSKCDSLIVRSSAVYSEDNDMTSGAGIYGTEKKVKTFLDFEKAVNEVFESVNSEVAKQHRKNYGINEELMGLVIQPYIESESKDIGYFNSSRPHLKHFLDFRNEKGFQITYDKRYLPMDLFIDRRDIFDYISLHFNIDLFDSDFPRLIDIRGLVKILYMFNRYFCKDLQMEVVSDYIVQMRPIINHSVLEGKVIFPCILPIFEGKSIIAGDKTADPSEILILDSSFNESEGCNIGRIRSGKIKLVIIRNSFDTSRGHIETTCAEKSVLCIIGDPFSDTLGNIPTGVSLRGVCDGDVGRVYLIE